MSTISTDNSNMWDKMESERFKYATFMLAVAAIIGGITGGVAITMSVATLLITLLPTMAVLAFTLSVAPMKWLGIATGIALSVDAVVYLLSTIG